jgi:hypothetical protein
MMVKVLVYGYATGVFSSRKIERRLHEDLAFRMLGAGNFPKHRTIRDFRALHLKELSDLFVQVVKLAREMGLVKLGTVAIDGTKIKANASRHKAMSYERMQQAEAELKAQIEALLERAKTTDAAEADEPDWTSRPRSSGARRGSRPSPKRASAWSSASAMPTSSAGRSADDECKPRDEDGNPKGGRYKREFGVPEPKAQDNFTDPASRIMKRAGGGFDASYNAQTAVDDTAHIIVAAEVGNNAADVGQLLPMLQAVKDNTGQAPEQALADAGYRSEDNFAGLAAQASSWWWHWARRASAAPRSMPRDPSAHGSDGRQAADRRGQGGLPQAQVDRRAAQRLDQERARVPPVQPARTAPGASRVQARVPGAESAAHGQHACRLRAHRCEKPTRTAAKAPAQRCGQLRHLARSANGRKASAVLPIRHPRGSGKLLPPTLLVQCLIVEAT